MPSDTSGTIDGVERNKPPATTDEFDPDDWVAYQCRYCGENCINLERSDVARAGLCLDCDDLDPRERADRLQDRRLRAARRADD